MISALLCFREKTPANPKQVITFNAPGVYIPPYGKGSFQLQGQGQPGNPSVPGNVSGTNPVTPGNYASTNPVTPGNYASTNPVTPGNHASTNPVTPGNYVSTNPVTPGNYASTNPGSGGNYAYTNGGSGGNVAANGNADYNPQYTYGSQYESYYTNLTGTSAYATNYSEVLSSAVPQPYSYSTWPGINITYVNYTALCVSGTDLGEAYIQYFTPGGYWVYNYSFWTAPHGSGPTPWSGATPVYGNAAMANYTIWSANVQNIIGYNPTYYNAYIAGDVVNNPYVAGTDNYNAPIAGNANYNAPIAGNANYNAPIAGNANYNTPIAGNANYNAPVPGNSTYNALIPGNASPTNVVLNVPLPGGGPDSTAPVIGYVTVPISYSPSGVLISVPPGGYVKIKNI